MASRRRGFRLHIVPPEGQPFEHASESEALVVGRAAGCDLPLSDPFLSRQHSRFFHRDGRLLVEDLGSRNATLVNGRLIEGPTEVGPGDVVQISGSLLTLLDRDAPPAPPAADLGNRDDPATVYRPAADLLESHDAGSAAAAAAQGGEAALRHYAERLKILNDVHQALGRSITLDALLELILDRVFDHLRPEQGVIFLKQPGGELVRAASRAVDARQAESVELPRLPEVAGYELHGGNTPSRGVSGDYFAVAPRQAGDGGRRECVLMVADVSGKGMAASLLTASLEAFSAGPIEDGLPPDEICAKLSRLLYRRTPPEKYATAFVAALDLASGAVRYANAGHNPPLLLRAAGETEELGATGVPIALLPDAAYETALARLAPGDTLILYTDGIVEANDPDGEEYGIERLAAICRRHCRAGCADLAAALEADLEAFVRGVPFADDRALLMARRLPAQLLDTISSLPSSARSAR